MPHIRFLFIGSHLCSTLPSHPASRRRPCASLSLHLHQVVKRTFTSKLSNMLGTLLFRPLGAETRWREAAKAARISPRACFAPWRLGVKSFSLRAFNTETQRALRKANEIDLWALRSGRWAVQWARRAADSLKNESRRYRLLPFALLLWHRPLPRAWRRAEGGSALQPGGPHSPASFIGRLG